MTDTEAKALVRSLMLIATNKALPINYRDCATGAAHYIEATEARHQADKDRYEKRTAMLLEREARYAAELREQEERFSEVAYRAKDMLDTFYRNGAGDFLAPFILPKPDPLVEVFGRENAAEIHATLAARGGKIVWGEE